ncbi:MAG TPA: hypothetical protein VLG47_02865 [Candidatus Saccharimonadales bacterium]|nr:hypothetical protein [Candidatus Saccharimonadales bacterium]
MKRLIVFVLILAGLFGPVFAAPAPAGATDVFTACSHGSGGTTICSEAKKGGNPVIHALSVALEIIAIIVGFAAVVMGVLAGIKLTLSNGDPSAVKSGRDTLIYALIGLVVALFAQAIVSFVLTKL